MSRNDVTVRIVRELSGDGVVVRALAAHQYGPDSIHGPDALSGLSLYCFFSLVRGFFAGFKLAGSCGPRLHMDRVAAAKGTLAYMLSVRPC